NLGSFLGLLAYPFAIEHLLATPQQICWWSLGYVAYAALFVLCAALTIERARQGAQDDARPPPAAPLSSTRGALLGWIAYAALGSTLLLATTNAMTQSTAVVPFLWTVPLSVYLFTFVAVFAQARSRRVDGYPRLYDPGVFAVAFLLLAGASLLQG